MSLLPFSALVTDQNDRIALGYFPDHHVLHKFGVNSAVGATLEDVWAVGGSETLLTTGTTLYLSCGDAAATQTIQVAGLDENWNLQTVSAALTGQAQVQLGATNGWTKVHRAYQISAGAEPAADVWIAEADTLTAGVPDTATGIHGYVDFANGINQTQQCVYQVPAGHNILLRGMVVRMSQPAGQARTVDAIMSVKELADTATEDTPVWAPWRTVAQIQLKSDLNPSETLTLQIPLKFGPQTHIHVRALASDTSTVAAAFGALVVQRA